MSSPPADAPPPAPPEAAPPAGAAAPTTGDGTAPGQPPEPAGSPAGTPPGPQDPEERWLREVQRHGEPQLTVRAVVAGMLIGGVMCLSNLYVVLKTGWSLGVTLTACILAYAVFRALQGVGISKREFGVLENNAMGSVASAAGYMTGGGNMAALPALLLLTGTMPPGPWLFLWFAAIAALGVFAAIPIKRQLINREELAFPTGTATAETLKSMHALEHAHDAADGAPAGGRTAGGGAEKARFLGYAGLVGALLAWFRDAKGGFMPFNIPGAIPFPFTIAGLPAAKWTLAIENSLVLAGAGALMSFKTGWSLLVGALLTWGWLAPSLIERGVVKTVSYKALITFTLWPGAGVLVASGLLSFAFEWRSIKKTFTGLGGSAGGAASGIAAVECPPWWFAAGFAVLGPVVVVLMSALFGIPWWMGLLTLPLAVIMGFIAARVTGETDTTPTKALGPVTQLVYGAAVPGNVAANIMGANVTGGVGLHAADLLTDLKSGWLLGANPRQQLVGQLFGVLAGAAVVVPAFKLLVPDASVLGSESLPAPAALVWAGVSRALAEGPAALDPLARQAALLGVGVGAGLAVLERIAPRRVQPFVPSASGLGIALMIPGFNAISMFVGCALATALKRQNPALAERTVVPISSGFIAGESLMGVVVAALVVAGVLAR